MIKRKKDGRFAKMWYTNVMRLGLLILFTSALLLPLHCTQDADPEPYNGLGDDSTTTGTNGEEPLGPGLDFEEEYFYPSGGNTLDLREKGDVFHVSLGVTNEGEPLQLGTNDRQVSLTFFLVEESLSFEDDDFSEYDDDMNLFQTDGVYYFGQLVLGSGPYFELLTGETIEVTPGGIIFDRFGFPTGDFYLYVIMDLERSHYGIEDDLPVSRSAEPISVTGGIEITTPVYIHTLADPSDSTPADTFMMIYPKNKILDTYQKTLNQSASEPLAIGTPLERFLRAVNQPLKSQEDYARLYNHPPDAPVSRTAPYLFDDLFYGAGDFSAGMVRYLAPDTYYLRVQLSPMYFPGHPAGKEMPESGNYSIRVTHFMDRDSMTGGEGETDISGKTTELTWSVPEAQVGEVETLTVGPDNLTEFPTPSDSEFEAIGHLENLDTVHWYQFTIQP